MVHLPPPNSILVTFLLHQERIYKRCTIKIPYLIANACAVVIHFSVKSGNLQEEIVSE